MTTPNLNCSRLLLTATKPRTHFCCLAENHWRIFRPRMVAELEAQGLLKVRLLEAVVQTVIDLDRTRHQLMRQNMTPEQARDQAWETVRTKYIFLPPEN